MDLIDTHAHLDAEQFQADLPAVIERARKAGVGRIVAVATTAASTTATLALAAAHPGLHPSAGIHPNHAAEAQPTDWDEVANLAARSEVVGVGETGLDRHWDFTPFPLQEDYFARHLALSRKLGKPVVIHCREADADVLRMLGEDFDRHGPLQGVMHSFSGDADLARACLDMGLYLSFAGMLTYKNAQQIRDVARTVPADRLLIETDSPYLAPVPHRGQRNEPAHVAHTLRCLANVRNADAEELAGQTMRNAVTLFGIGD